MARAKHLSIANIVSHGNSLNLETLTYVRPKENVHVIFIRTGRCVTSLIVIQLASGTQLVYQCVNITASTACGNSIVSTITWTHDLFM